MDKMRHILGSRSAGAAMMGTGGGVTTTTTGGGGGESRSVFHINVTPEDHLQQDMRECYQGIEEFGRALRNLDGAGTHLTESLAQALRNTQYQRMGEQVAGGFREVYGSQVSQRFLEQLKEMEGVLKGLGLPQDGAQEELRHVYAQTCCHMLLLFTKLQKQYLQVCHHHMARLLHHLLLSAKDLDPSGELTKTILKLGLAEEAATSPSDTKTIASSLPSTPWGSPKLRKALLGSPKTGQNRGGSGFRLFSLFERKPSPEEGRSEFYVSVGESGSVELKDSVGDAGEGGGGGGAASMTTVAEGASLGSVPLVTRTDEMNNECAPEFTLEDSASGRLASEEDLDSVINLLSGVTPAATCTSPTSPHSPFHPPTTPTSMLSIPEDLPQHGFRDTSPSTPNSLPCDFGQALHPSYPPYSRSPDLRQCSRSPMQLAVPPGASSYRMRSPASDTQVEELRVPKMQAQIHRRSEGCLDLSSMGGGGGGGGTWPHPHHPQHPHHHHHHRASLPAVQLHSPYHRQNLDPFLDAAPPSPLLPARFVSSPQDSYAPLPTHPPPIYLGSSGNSGGGGVSGMAGSSQWFGGGGGGGGELRGSGTWPLYPPTAMPLGDSLNSSWSGVHDGSDGSDDSSNGDHFFAVGKDIVNTIDSRQDSSEDEGESCRNNKFVDFDRQAISTNTWPMMQHLPGAGLHFPPAADFPDLMDPPPPSLHRPLQMQWSDPVASRNIWSAATPGMNAHKTNNQTLQPPHSNSQTMPGFGRLN